VGPNAKGCWVGVDVGARRKGFHVAVSSERAIERLVNFARPLEVVELLAAHRPAVVAVDGPRSFAKPGARSRADERELAAALACGIRFTPSEEDVRSHRGAYYGWVLNGLELYGALEAASAEHGWRVIECFPTASFTVLGGRRGAATRAAWSASVLAELAIEGLPAVTSQDERDAIMAAITARAYDRGRVTTFGEIVVATATA
jgi:predicted nuclease with RNAse H fold